MRCRRPPLPRRWGCCARDDAGAAPQFDWGHIGSQPPTTSSPSRAMSTSPSAACRTVCCTPAAPPASAHGRESRAITTFTSPTRSCPTGLGPTATPSPWLVASRTGSRSGTGSRSTPPSQNRMNTAATRARSVLPRPHLGGPMTTGSRPPPRNHSRPRARSPAGHHGLGRPHAPILRVEDENPRSGRSWNTDETSPGSHNTDPFTLIPIGRHGLR